MMNALSLTSNITVSEEMPPSSSSLAQHQNSVRSVVVIGNSNANARVQCRGAFIFRIAWNIVKRDKTSHHVLHRLVESVPAELHAVAEAKGGRALPSTEIF